MDTKDDEASLRCGSDTDPTIEILSVAELFKKTLRIPEYQRPYMWSSKNVRDLMDDIEDAIQASKKYHGYKYRFGTVILCENNEESGFDIVDGQQRIISFLLLFMALDSCGCQESLGALDEYKERLFVDSLLSSKNSRANLRANYRQMKDALCVRGDLEKLVQSLDTIFEVVVITVREETEAFQLFDSQNSRGKSLDPTDLLKAYHLREIPRQFDRLRAAVQWESYDPHSISELFSKYLYPIARWSEREDADGFTSSQIDRFKGLTKNDGCPAQKRVEQAMPRYQITEQFMAGSDFFGLVDYYLSLSNYLFVYVLGENALCKLSDGEALGENDSGEKEFADIAAILNDKTYIHSTGFRFTCQLFECALLQYYDKFGGPDALIAHKLFTWSFMHRVDMRRVSWRSINKYAKGEAGSSYSNTIPLFSLIRTARLASDVRSLQIDVINEADSVSSDNWCGLYASIKRMNGLENETNHQ